jgi:hypothetical protein
LRKAPPTLKVGTSFNIVAGGATELSGCDFSAEVEMRQAEGEGEMNDRLSFSIFTIEVDGKPTLAFDAKRYSEAEAICGDEGLRAKLSLLKSGDVPLCGDNAILDVRLAHPDEAALYRQAAGASQSTDDLMLVYLVELDGPADQLT